MDPGVILDRVRAFVGGASSESFESLALDVFRFQYESVPAYRAYCDRAGRPPENVATWLEVPAVPVAAFQHADLAAPALEGGLELETSGTTEGPERRGRHRVAVPEIYREGALVHFRRLVLPDEARLPFVALVPTAAEAPRSSLCRMVAWLSESFGAGAAQHFVREGALDLEPLRERLEAASASGEPVMLIGLTHALVELLDALRDAPLRLPYGSRVVDTGGTKNRMRPVSRNALLRMIWDRLGISGSFVANEYGMTEMCSQFYDSSILDHFDGRKRDRFKVPPPWVRSRLADPETLEVADPPVPGARGLLRHWDLANVASVSVLQTEDVGLWGEEGFEVAGRAKGAERRGCAQLLERVRG